MIHSLSRGLIDNVMKLFQFIFLTSAFGAAPVALRLGPISLSGLLTTLICLAAGFAFIFRPVVLRTSLSVIIPILFFWVWSLAWFLWGFEVDKQLDSYLVVWGGMLFILLLAARVDFVNSFSITSLEKTVFFSTWIYLIVLGFEVLIKSNSPATTQVGLIFFSFHLVKLFNGGRHSVVILLIIIFMQIMLGARIVVAAEILLLGFGNSMLNGLKIPSIRNFSWPNLIVACIFVGAIIYSFNSNIAEKSFNTGDSALDIYGITINTSGRMFMWEVVVDSALDSPWFGHGSPGPEVMLRTPRWSHPHNDYLRLFHQLGLVGLVFWLLFVVQSLIKAWRGARYLSSVQARSWCHTTFLTIIGLSIMMITDNTIVYSYVVYPVSVMIGITIVLQGSALKCEHHK